MLISRVLWMSVCGLAIVYMYSGVVQGTDCEQSNNGTSGNGTTNGTQSGNTTSNRTVKICAFNIKSYGPTKMGKQHIVDIIVAIIRQCDIMLIQEIRDSQLELIANLSTQVGSDYGYADSIRLGRLSTSYREQYCYFYRLATIILNATHQYEDGVDDGTDAFTREPLCALFTLVNSSLSFAVIGIHTSPSAALSEITALFDVYTYLRTTVWPNTPNVVLMGDFNADNQVSESTLQTLDLYNTTTFNWLIKPPTDTTVSTNNDYTYDRAVLAGETLNNSYVVGSAGTIRFDLQYNLHQDNTSATSDHFPTQFDIYA